MNWPGAVQDLDSRYVIAFEGSNDKVTSTKFCPKKGLISAIVDFFY